MKMQTMTIGAGALLLAASLVIPTSVKAGDGAKLPADVKITCFDTLGLSEIQSAFCGKWGEGKWDSVLPHRLVVESIAPDGSASIIYAWGTASEWRVYESGFTRAEAQIEGNLLSSTLPNGSKAEYRVDGDKLRGKSRNRSFRSTIVLRRSTD